MSTAPIGGSGRTSSVSETVKNILYPTAAIVFLIGAWFVCVWAFRPPVYILPSPARVWAKTIDQWSSLFVGILATTQVAIAGLMVALVIEVVLGMAIGWWTVVRKLLWPPIIITQSIPKIAIAPLLIVWFGYGAFPKLIVVVLVTFFPILEACAVGIRSLPRSTFILAQSIGTQVAAAFFQNPVASEPTLPHGCLSGGLEPRLNWRAHSGIRRRRAGHRCGLANGHRKSGHPSGFRKHPALRHNWFPHLWSKYGDHAAYRCEHKFGLCRRTT